VQDGLELDTALRLANGFGGGMRCGELCGAVTGAVMAIGLKCGFYIENDFDQKNYCNKKSYEFIERFSEANGSIICRELLNIDVRCPADHATPESQAAHKAVCRHLVTSAAKILDSLVI